MEMLKKSYYMEFGVKIESDVYVAQRAATMNKAKELELWQDIEPDDDFYNFELATELPYYLPNLEGKAEYTITFNRKEYFICNRIIKAFIFSKDADVNYLNYYIIHLLGLPNLKEQNPEKIIQTIPMKTFISRKIKIKGNNAEEIIEKKYHSWRSDFIKDIANIINAIRIINPDNTDHIFPQFEVISYPIIWVFIKGKNGKLGCLQFAGDLRKSVFRATGNINTNSKKRLKKILEGNSSVQIYESAISLANIYKSHGFYDLFILQICIAIETVLIEKLYAFLEKRKMSTNHIEKYVKNIMLNELLNIHLPLMFDLTQLQNYEHHLGHLNHARKLRNEIMHTGRPLRIINIKQVDDIIKSANILIAFVKNKDTKKLSRIN